MSSIFAPALDVEAGPDAGHWNQPVQPLGPALHRRAQASQRFIVGVVVLLFVAGIVPFSSLLFLLVGLFLFASCIQYHVLARSDVQHISPSANATLPAGGNAERMQRAAVLSMLGTFGLGNPAFGNALAGRSTGGAFHNLRLSMMNRDFTDADYEMLLQLDQTDNPAVSAAFEEQMTTLPSFTFEGVKAAKSATGMQNEDKEHNADNSNTCSVCLEPFVDQDQLTMLPCTHKFHTSCIQPWLRQSGQRSQCPLCKTAIFGGE